MNPWAAIPHQVDLNQVGPGWGAGLVTIFLAAALVLLYFSLRRQVRRISIPGEDEEDAQAAPEVDIKTPPNKPAG